MTVSLTDEVFAKLVGQRDDKRTLLFEVSPAFLEQASSGEWSGPVQFRFVGDAGGLIDMEIRTLEMEIRTR